MASDLIAAVTEEGTTAISGSSVAELQDPAGLESVGLSILNLGFAANPMGAILQTPAVTDVTHVQESDGDAAIRGYRGERPLGAVYGAEAIGGVPLIVTKEQTENTHQAQFGNVELDPDLRDFRIEATYDFDGDLAVGFGQYIDFGEAVEPLSDQLDDAEQLAGTYLDVSHEWGEPFGAGSIEAPAGATPALRVTWVTEF